MAQGHQRAVKDLAWLLDTTNRMVGCRSVAALLDVAYDAIRFGLGYDRVGLLLVDAAHQALVARIGTDVHGNKFYPQDRVNLLVAGSYHARLLADPRMQSDGPGFIYMNDATVEVPQEAHRGLDGRPGPSLRVSLRSADAVLGLIGVDNLTSGRSLTPADAPPLVAFGNVLAATIESVSALEDRAQRIDKLDVDLRERVAQLNWLQTANARMAMRHDLDSVLDEIYHSVLEGLGFDRAGIFLIDHDADGGIRERAVRGTDDQGHLVINGATDYFVSEEEIAHHAPDLRHLLEGHAYYYCADRWAITPQESRGALVGRMREQLVVALRHDDAFNGYISVDNLLSGRPLTEETAPPFVAFAAQAALAISRAQLWEAHEAQGENLARRVAELEWLREISGRVNAAHSLAEVLDVVYDGIRKGLGYDRVGIDLLNYESGTFVEALGTDASGHKTQPTDRVASNGREDPMWTDPGVIALIEGAEFFYTTDAYATWPVDMRYLLDGMPREILQVPLRCDGKVTGIISVDNLLTSRPISAEDAGPLLALAHHVSTAIENAQLHERERAERAHLEVTARTDYLTVLGNHRAFHEEFQREGARAWRQDQPLVLALIDVDDFKGINDRHGHGQGDRVLATLGHILRSNRSEDRAFRLGGDEFALILPATTVRDAVGVVERLRQDAHRLLEGVTLSIGIAGVHTGENDLDNLREEADAALYEAKRRGRNMVVVFADMQDDRAMTTPAKMEAVRHLLAEGRIDVHFQPIWDLEHSGLLGVEALSRLAVNRGLDGPREAFEVATKMGRAQDLDTLCRHAILGQASRLPPDTLVFLNVAQITLDHTTLTGSSLVQAVQAVGLRPDRVVLEVTEKAGAWHASTVHEALRLQSLGFRLALDDAGAGNTGLELLSRLPVDYIKIGGSLITRAMTNTTAHAVLKALIAFAQHTTTCVIAEGIETEAMLAFVRHAGDPHNAGHECIRGVQGYLVGRPSADVETMAFPGVLQARAAAG